MVPRIPFNRVTIQADELDRIREAVEGGQIGGNEAFSRKCQALLEGVLGAPRCMLTPSGTAALEMAALLLDIGPGDEVIVPTFTFVSTANAFARRGARPVFCDSRPDTFNLDEGRLEALITERTRVIVPVHYAGVACEMDAILDIAGRHGVKVVEDNAHGLFGKHRGRWLGTFGALAAQSFHATKNLTAGEGGALLVNDASLAGRADVIQEKGTDRRRFFRGDVDAYTWQDTGGSYTMSELLAAFLYAQLEVWPTIQDRRRTIWRRYDDRLAAWREEQGVRGPVVPAHCEQSWHMYHLLLPSTAARARLLRHLERAGIKAVFHYVPLHLSDYARRWGGQPGDCPVAEDVSARLVRLPFYTGMEEATQDRVIEALRDFRVSA